MQTGLRGRDLIDLSDWTNEEIETALDVAFDLKRKRALGEAHPYLRDRVLSMLFFFSSTRTRASFEAGMAQLGGHAMFIESRTTQIAHGDTATEIGEILGRYSDGLAIRHVTFGEGNQYIRDVAAASRVPVLNMQCEVYHPFQTLADLMTIIEKKGKPEGPVDHGQLGLRGQLPEAHQRAPVAHPGRHALRHERQARASAGVPAHAGDRGAGGGQRRPLRRLAGEARRLRRRLRGGGRRLRQVLGRAACWASRTRRAPRSRAKYTDWISDERRMALTRDDAIWMHPLPADRNVEVADAVIDGPKSAAFDEAENRLHAQKAVMALTMG